MTVDRWAGGQARGANAIQTRFVSAGADCPSCRVVGSPAPQLRRTRGVSRYGPTRASRTSPAASAAAPRWKAADWVSQLSPVTEASDGRSRPNHTRTSPVRGQAPDRPARTRGRDVPAPPLQCRAVRRFRPAALKSLSATKCLGSASARFSHASNNLCPNQGRPVTVAVARATTLVRTASESARCSHACNKLGPKQGLWFGP